MTQDHLPVPGRVAVSSTPDLDGPEPRRIPGAQFARLWQSEVPKVVERHEAERLQVRRALGLIG